MKTKYAISMLVFLLAVSLFSAHAGSGAAGNPPAAHFDVVSDQPLEPGQPPEAGRPMEPGRTVAARAGMTSPEGAILTPEGQWMMPADAVGPERAAPTAGGPDEYGYTWNTVGMSWIEASGGTDTGMSGDSYDQATGPIPLPFSFKFYENSYTSLYIAASGYVSFQDWFFWDTQQNAPEPFEPNDAVAPYWSPLYLSNSGANGRVYYMSGGSAPNRYFVVQWHNVNGDPPGDPIGGDDTFRFQLILHENGDIVFQYQYMNYNGNWWCGGQGIEDSLGLDGLSMDYCNAVASNRAVRIYRPAPAARPRLIRLAAGGFTSAGEAATMRFPLRNLGELGTDTFDLLTSASWPISFYAADGVTPLTDTNGNGIVDSGPLSPLIQTEVVARITAPGGAVAGASSQATLTARSAIDTTRTDTMLLQAAVPTQFANVFMDGYDGTERLQLAHPAGQAELAASPDGHYGYSQAVAETPNSDFVYAWAKYRWTGSVSVYEIHYRLFDRFGTPITPILRLTDESGASTHSNNYTPVIAVAPDGRIGIAWYRYLYNSANGQFNYNIYFAVLDPDGNVQYGPQSLTNNSLWGDSDDINVPRMFLPRIAATDNNRFVVAWGQGHYAPPGGGCTSFCYVRNIHIAVRDSAGGLVKPPTRYTNGSPFTYDYFYEPALAALDGNRVALFFNRQGNITDLYLAVLDSAGNTVRAMAPVTNNNYDSYEYGPDAVQLTGGNILVAWRQWSALDYSSNIAYAMLNSAYNIIYGPATLNNPGSQTRFEEGYVSVTRDANNHGILTWRETYPFTYNLFYALVNSGGGLVTSPTAYRGAESMYYPYMYSSYDGYGATTYSWDPPDGVDMTVDSGNDPAGEPGGTAGVHISLGNHGETKATGVVISATLDVNLTYVSDSSGVIPVANGDTISWELPDHRFLDRTSFILVVGIPPDASYGDSFSVSVEIVSDGPEELPGNNDETIDVMVSRQAYLPALRR